MSLRPGEIIDNKYRIVRLIGEGGMGSVHEGENVRIKRRVAIKVLHKQDTNHEAAMLRFEREAQAAGHIGSDHIMEVLDLGMLPDGDRYMVMEYLDGEPLSSRIRNAVRLTPHQLLPLLRQALIGLEAAHRAGIIHRDLKPDNIFIVREKAGKSDYVKLIDFGISKFNVLGGDMAMTSTGAVMGTPYYMSPEQAKGSRSVDARSDLYSMGVIAFEALTGEVPFDGSTFNELMFKIVLADPPQLKLILPEMDSAFAAIVEKMMAREADARYQTAPEVVAALDTWASGAQGQATFVSAASPVVPRDATKAVLAASAPGGMSPATVGTGSTWATSQVDQLPKKSLAPLFVAGGAGLLLLVGGVVAAVKLTSSEPASNSVSAASADMPAVIASGAVDARTLAKTPEPAVKVEAPAAPGSAQPVASAPPALSAASAAPDASDAAAPQTALRTRAPSQTRPVAKTSAPTTKSPTKSAAPTTRSREFGY